MEYQPILPPVGTKFGNNRWEVYSPKVGRRVYLYSDLEYYHWLKVETDPKIIDFCEQPLKIIDSNPSNLTKSYSIPDMITEDINHNLLLVEVKYTAEIMDVRVQNQIRIQQDWAKSQHILHEVFTDKILDNRFYLSAWKQIIQTVASTNREFLKLTCKKILQLPHNYVLTIENVLNSTKSNRDDTLNALFHLIYDGHIAFVDLSEKMSKSSEVIIYD